MGNKIKWQSVTVKFPKKLYLYAIWTKSESLMIYTTNVLHKSFAEMLKDAKKTVKYYQENSTNEETVISAILVMPVSFVKNYPLKKSLWREPKLRLDKFDRLLEFIKAIEKPHFYHLCVTPSFGEIKKGKKRVISFGAPFPIHKSSEKNIDDLMKASDFPVTPEAKNCAIYKFDRVYGYDLESGEIVDREVKETQLMN
ncbi:hypothetical protein JXA63_05135 [Candidatus Woesebacteria bacterium]|nr:hypothetical protein [Candidatus Woesebacteria bacterium]